jgi:hypothetical protein
MIEYPDRISIDSPFSTLPGDYWLRLSSGAACLFRVLAWPPHCKCSRPGWEVIPLLTLGGYTTRQGYPRHIAIPNCEMHAPTDAKADTGPEGR